MILTFCVMQYLVTCFYIPLFIFVLLLLCINVLDCKLSLTLCCVPS
jgi:hypothetical protein